MADQWYYGRGAEVFGPMTGWDVADLADAGDLLRTDTVWEDGDEDGVQAGSIPHLFPDAVVPTTSTATVPAARKARAVAGPGVQLVGQDGKTVKYRMTCVTCKHEDRSWKTIAITRGATRVGFFCPKCRRRKTGEVNGFVS